MRIFCGLLIGISLIMVGSSALGATATPTGLAYEERVACQRAIEEVYWIHRIWPKENTQSKPDLETVLTESAIRAKVKDYLQKSEALEKWWQQSITGEQLQAEMNRMAQKTRQASVLADLWNALENDPSRIAECLARPLLVDRLIRERYAADDRFHGEVKAQAAADRLRFKSVRMLTQMARDYTELEWMKGPAEINPSAQFAIDPSSLVVLEEPAWEAFLRELAYIYEDAGEADIDTGMLVWSLGANLAREGHQRVNMESNENCPEGTVKIPIGRASRLLEDAHRIYSIQVQELSSARVRLGLVQWRKVAFDLWWLDARNTLQGEIQPPSFAYQRPEIKDQFCALDTWTPMRERPRADTGYKGVWTGADLLFAGFFSQRYNPATDTWTPMSTTNQPPGAGGGSAIWTGTELIAWGGTEASSSTNTGGRYNPDIDQWIPTSRGKHVPSPRLGHTAIWTGAEMIVWGGCPTAGCFGSFLATGARYDPTSDSWMPIAAGPEARGIHDALWTGAEMLVWGGAVSAYHEPRLAV